MKRIVRILMVLLVMSLIAFTGGGCTDGTRKAYHASRADRYYEAGQLPQAEIEYLSVLRFDPANTQAYSRLGLIYYEEGRLPQAAYFLSKAIEMSPDNLELRRDLGFVSSMQGQFTNVLAQANYILSRKPQDGDAAILLAEGSVLPKDAAAATLRLQAMAQQHDNASIEAALGDLAMRNHDVTTAAAAYKKGQALDPKSCPVNVGLAVLAWSQGDLKQADACFRAAIESVPVRSIRRLQYIRFKIQTGDTAGARAALADLIKQAPDYVPASKALAELAVAEKKYDEAEVLVENILKQDPYNVEVLLFQGQLEVAAGKPDQAVAHLERLARLDPQEALAHYQLGTAYLAAGDTAKAAASFSRALELYPNSADATLMLANIQLNNRNPDAAIRLLEPVCQKQPRLVQPQLLLADAYRARSRLSDALSIYQKVESMEPTNVPVLLLHSQALGQMNDAAGARNLIEKALALAPDNGQAVRLLLDLDLSEKQFDAAWQFINRKIQKDPKEITWRILAAKIQVMQGKSSDAEAILLQALEMDQSNLAANLALAQFYSDDGQSQKALARLNAALTKYPTNSLGLMLAGDVYSRIKDNKRAAEAYENLLKVDPKNVSALNNLAYLYAEYLNNLDRAYDLAQSARQMSPESPFTADTLGWICYERGSYDTALGLLKLSASKLDDPEVQFHYGMVSYMTGDEATARAALQKAWQSGKDFPARAECGVCLSILAINPATADAAARATLEKRVAEKSGDLVALLRLARLNQRDGNTDKAIAEYESVLQVQANNLDAMVNLTRLYAVKDARKGYEMAKAAAKLAPDNPDVAQNLGRLAFQSGDYQVAASSLQTAAQNRPNDAPLLFDYAQATYAVGRVTTAQASLQKAVTLGLAPGQAAQARQMLDLINLAAMPAQAVAAVSRVNDILKSTPEDVPALMARAAASESASDTATAEQACEKVLGHYPNFTPAQIQLARLYSADPAKLDRAYSLASRIHDLLPDDPDAAKRLGIVLYLRADYSHAVNLLKQSALKLNSDAELYYYLGAAQYRLKNRTEGKANLQQALALNLSGRLVDSAKQMLADLK